MGLLTDRELDVECRGRSGTVRIVGGRLEQTTPAAAGAILSLAQ